MKRLSAVVLFALGLLFTPVASSAFTLTPVPYSGQLTDGGVPVNGTRYFTLRLYDAPSGGTIVFTQAESLQVIDGIYHTQLQTVETVWNGADRWLGVSVNGGAELTPRQKIGWVPYAVHTLTNPPTLVVRPQTSMTVNGSAWVAVDSLTITTSVAGIAIINMEGYTAWTGSISAPGMGMNISTTVPTDNLIVITAKTDVHPLSPTLMVALTPGTYVYKVWAKVAAVGQSYFVYSSRFQATFIPFNL